MMKWTVPTPDCKPNIVNSYLPALAVTDWGEGSYPMHPMPSYAFLRRNKMHCVQWSLFPRKCRIAAQAVFLIANHLEHVLFQRQYKNA